MKNPTIYKANHYIDSGGYMSLCLCTKRKWEWRDGTSATGKTELRNHAAAVTPENRFATAGSFLLFSRAFQNSSTLYSRSVILHMAD